MPTLAIVLFGLAALVLLKRGSGSAEAAGPGDLTGVPPHQYQYPADEVQPKSGHDVPESDEPLPYTTELRLPPGPSGPTPDDLRNEAIRISLLQWKAANEAPLPTNYALVGNTTPTTSGARMENVSGLGLPKLVASEPALFTGGKF